MKIKFLAIALVASASCFIQPSNRTFGDTFGSGANTFNIEFVTIGNPGNAADPLGDPNPAGSVPYVFGMGKYEISRDMIAKANDVGNLAITLDDLTQYGGNGANRPSTGVSWNEAARFVNWLNASTGSPLAYKFAMQPSDAGYSANADIQVWTASDAGYNPNNLYRNNLARYFLPSDDERYKAAYYDPASGVYFAYPTGSNSAPTHVVSGTAEGTAVYNGQAGPADITLAGGLSPYGTMGQGGNVYEWVETDIDLVNGPDPSLSHRAGSGGGWSTGTDSLLASSRSDSLPSIGYNDGGLRVASVVPEPSAFVLFILSVLGVSGISTRRRLVYR